MLQSFEWVTKPNGEPIDNLGNIEIDPLILSFVGR